MLKWFLPLTVRIVRLDGQFNQYTARLISDFVRVQNNLWWPVTHIRTVSNRNQSICQHRWYEPSHHDTVRKKSMVCSWIKNHHLGIYTNLFHFRITSYKKKGFQTAPNRQSQVNTLNLYKTDRHLLDMKNMFLL